MKHAIAMAVLGAATAACVPTKDLAKTLRYADNRPVGVEHIRFVELERMKRGRACTVNFAYVLPIYGDGSIITAADQGDINTVQLIGETGHWYFPFSTSCTVVFGDKLEAPAAPGADA